MKTTLRHLNFEYIFERRRYGATGTMRFYTWLLYRKIDTMNWQSYGDPWPKARLNKRELAEALNKVTFRLLEPGQRVRTVTGRTAAILSKHEENFAEVFLVKLDDIEYKSFEIPASAIIEVL